MFSIWSCTYLLNVLELGRLFHFFRVSLVSLEAQLVWLFPEGAAHFEFLGSSLSQVQSWQPIMLFVMSGGIVGLSAQIWQLRSRVTKQERLQQTLEKNLKALQHLSAASIADLSTEQVPTVMLERIKTLLDADTAVLLVREGQSLRAVAALGTDTELLLGTKVSIGQGFLGTIAATLQPLYIEDIGSSQHTNSPGQFSFDWQHPSTKTLLGVPLKYSGRLLGVLSVSWETYQDYSDRSIRWLEIAAEHCSWAVAQEQLRLQLATHFPEMADLQLADIPKAIESKDAHSEESQPLFSPFTAKFRSEIQRALAEHEFELLYQPIVSLLNQELMGFEALIRWNHPQYGLMMPANFIHHAEATDLILGIGRWTLETACRQMKQWQEQFPCSQNLLVSVNLSARQFAQPNLLEQVRSTLESAELRPECLKLEITETAIMQDPNSAIAVLLQLHDMGVRLSIDDFGTGYSSLSYLYRFPVDTLKVDQSFIEQIDADAEKIELVRTVLMMAWNLGLDTIAEGVENRKQLAQLKALKCDYGQGYFFDRPLNTEAVEALLQAQGSSPHCVVDLTKASNNQSL